jgi:hypothetical protein
MRRRIAVRAEMSWESAKLHPDKDSLYKCKACNTIPM